MLLHRGHVGVDLLPTMLGERGKFILELIGGLISLAFCGVLAEHGVTVSVRRPRGQDILAACGQLHLKRRVPAPATRQAAP